MFFALVMCVHFSHDKFCPFYKSVWMMRNMILFHQLATQVPYSSPLP